MSSPGAIDASATVSAPVPAREGIYVAAGTPGAALGFTTLVMAACLFLQRLALPLGAEGISLAGPIGVALALYGLSQGTLSLHRGRLAIYLTLLGLAAIGGVWEAVHPNHFGVPPIWPSLAQFLVLTAFATLVFTEPVDEASVFRAIKGIRHRTGRIARFVERPVNRSGGKCGLRLKHRTWE